MGFKTNFDHHLLDSNRSIRLCQSGSGVAHCPFESFHFSFFITIFRCCWTMKYQETRANPTRVRSSSCCCPSNPSQHTTFFHCLRSMWVISLSWSFSPAWHDSAKVDRFIGVGVAGSSRALCDSSEHTPYSVLRIYGRIRMATGPSGIEVIRKKNLNVAHGFARHNLLTEHRNYCLGKSWAEQTIRRSHHIEYSKGLKE